MDEPNKYRDVAIIGKDLNGKEIGKGIVQRKSGIYYGRAVVKGVKIELYNHSLQDLKRELEEDELLRLWNRN